MGPLTTIEGEPIGAVYGVAGLMLKTIEEMKPEYIIGCFDRPEPTFRKEEYKEYKANRAEVSSELIPQFDKVKEMFSNFGVHTLEKPGFEADDIIGTLANKYKSEAQVVIMSSDRDLLQLIEDDRVVVEIIKNANMSNVLYDEKKVLEDYGIYPRQIIDLKGLVGDASDNIPGVPGVGPKTATPLIKEFESVEGVYENLVIIPEKITKKLEGFKEQALLSKRLATINLEVPLDFTNLEEVRFKGLNKLLLTDYFEKLGFVSLIAKL